MKRLLSVFALILFGAINCYAQSPLSKVGGKTYASAYAGWRVTIQSAPTATGAGTITVTPGIPSNPDGSQVNNAFVSPGGGIYTPIIVGQGSANQETVTPTAVSGCNSSGAGTASCLITATFANTHGPGDIVVSGDAGIQEAINSLGGINPKGVVVVDGAAGATDAMITATVVSPGVVIEDTRGYSEKWWSPVGNATAIAVPTVLTAVTALPSATPVGGYGTGTYYMCIAYVDIMGQEGACSTTFSQAGLATGSFIFSPPAASTGAVGYTIYISLTSGTYQLAYKVPLVTQPAAVGAYPVSNGVCTLTTVETVTPACAVTNTVYGSVGATATVTAITVNTSPIDPQVTVVSTTSVYVPNAGGRANYSYAPGMHIGEPGLPGSMLAYTISAAPATVVPTVVGTVNISPGFMNVLGKTLEVCGEMTGTATAATIVDVQFQWDAMGQNTAGKGVLIGDLTGTPSAALASTGHVSFCQDFQTTVTSASATGGSINHVGGYGGIAGVTVAGSGALGDVVTPGAIGSLNLADDARINVIYLHTTATDGAGWILQNLSFKVIN